MFMFSDYCYVGFQIDLNYLNVPCANVLSGYMLQTSDHFLA